VLSSMRPTTPERRMRLRISFAGTPFSARAVGAVGALLTALGLAAAPAARAQVELNQITSIDVKDAGGNMVVSVKGSKPPNFTTFSMTDPPRFVIDFSESVFQGVPEDIPVNNGVITVVKNLSYGSEATSIARVM